MSFATGRLFIRGAKVAEWNVDKASVFDVMTVLKNLMREHPEFPEAPHMIEIEFHMLPESERFTRFGTDPTMMGLPCGAIFPSFPKRLT